MNEVKWIKYVLKPSFLLFKDIRKNLSKIPAIFTEDSILPCRIFK